MYCRFCGSTWRIWAIWWVLRWLLCTYQCYAWGGGWGPWDRVGTLIRNENLESNFLTLGIRFQFKVPHFGEGFEFNISYETENFKPSDHEVKNMCLHLTRLSMIVLLQWKAAGRSALFIKRIHPNKASKTSFNLTFTQLMNSQTPKYYRSLLYIIESTFTIIPVFHVES